jgi:hypothetical protein
MTMTISRATATEPWSASIDTARLLLPPEFLRELRAAVPRRRRAKGLHLVVAGFLVVLAAVGADPSTREFVAARWRGTPSIAAKETLPAATTERAPPVASGAPAVASAPSTAPEPSAIETPRAAKKARLGRTKKNAAP